MMKRCGTAVPSSSMVVPSYVNRVPGLRGIQMLSIWIGRAKRPGSKAASGGAALAPSGRRSCAPAQPTNSPTDQMAASAATIVRIMAPGPPTGSLQAVGILQLHQQLIGIETETISEIAHQVVVEHDEQIAEGIERPTQPRIGTETPALVVVLQEAAHLQVGRHVHLSSGAVQALHEGSLRQSGTVALPAQFRG